MKNELLNSLKNEYPEYFMSNKFDFEINNFEIKKLFRIINKIVLNSKLDEEKVRLEVVDYNGQQNKGSFALVDDEKYETVISIVRYSYGDNFEQIVSVLSHEMIHMYDRYYGELKKRIDNEFSNGVVDVKNINNRQFVGDYDPHGKYFNVMVKKFGDFGVKVKVKYDINDKNLMKKIKEGFDPIFGCVVTESEEVDNVEFKDKLKSIYDSLKNCDKKFKYIDKHHWYIQID